MQDLEQKRKNIEKLVGGSLLIIVGFVVAPFIFIALKGLAGLLVAGTILTSSYYLAPAMGRWLANLRIKALKAVSASDPIGTLQNIYAEKKAALIKQRDNIKQLLAVGMKIFEQIKSYEERFNKPSARRASYEQLQALINVTKAKYARAQKNLVGFGEYIEEKTADWEIACSMAEASKLAKIGEDFVSKLMQDTAFNTIQDGLNTAFAELDASVMDENIQKTLAGQTVEITVSGSEAADAEQVKALSTPTRISELELEFEDEAAVAKQNVSVRNNRK